MKSITINLLSDSNFAAGSHIIVFCRDDALHCSTFWVE